MTTFVEEEAVHTLGVWDLADDDMVDGLEDEELEEVGEEDFPEDEDLEGDDEGDDEA